MPDDPEKGTVRKSEVRASDIIAAQKRADLEKEAKDLLTAERTAYAKQDQHCQLVNQRGMKQTQLEALKHKAARATLETDLMVGELDALRTRLAMLQHEVKTMEIEMALEVDTTPRYEHMRDRTRFDVDEVANRCMPPTRELAELLTQMTRIGGSHYTEQFAARSLLQAVERLGLQLQARNKYNELEIAQLELEKGVTAESKEAVRDIMRRKHESSLQMSGDKTAEEEANLVSAANSITGKTAALAVEKVYSRERINDILFKYGKLSAAFNETEPEELVDKVLRMCTGSESEKVEHLNRDAQKAKDREERLRDEILQLQRKREMMRFDGEADTTGFLVLTPRGENVMDYGGDDEVIALGGQLKDSARKAAEAVERYRKVALLLTSGSIALSGLMSVVKVLKPPNGVPASLTTAAEGGSIPMHATPEALDHVAERLLSTTSQFEKLASAPHANQAPEFIDKAARQAVRAYNEGYPRIVSSWTEPASSSRATSRGMTPRQGPVPPEEGDEGGLEGWPPPTLVDGLVSPTEGIGSPTSLTVSAEGLGQESSTSLYEGNQGMSLVRVGKQRVSRTLGSHASGGGPGASKTSRTVLPPLTTSALAPASSASAPMPPPPPLSLFAQMGMARGGEFGSATHLAHVAKMQLDFGETSGNNIRIPLALGSDDEDGPVDDSDDDATEDGKPVGDRGSVVPRGARLPPAGKSGQNTKAPAQAEAGGGASASPKPSKKSKSVTMNLNAR